MAGYQLGIDFGTTFSSAAVSDGERSRVVTIGGRSGSVPTSVFIRGDGTFVFGEGALAQGLGDPTRLVRDLKRHLGDPQPLLVGDRSFDTIDLAAGYLRWMVDSVVEREGSSPDRIVIAHPANWRDHKIGRLVEAATRAGLTNLVTTTEPHAAALYYAADHRVPEGAIVGVYDLGGGTFDAAVLRKIGGTFELIGRPEGVEHLGGVDFDAALTYHVKTEVGAPWNELVKAGGEGLANAEHSLWREIVAAKEALSDEHEVDIAVLAPNISTTVRVTRADFEQMIRPALAESQGAFERALRNAGIGIEALAVLLLVGGSSRIPLVSHFIGEMTGDRTVLSADPKYAVAGGAALYRDAEPMVEPPASRARAASTVAAAPAPEPAPRRERSRKAALVPLGLLALVGVGALVWALLRSDGDDGGPAAQLAVGSETATTVSLTMDEPGGNANDARVPSGQRMVAVTAGEFPIGLDAGSINAAPADTVEVDSFHIDDVEVTNADYLAFISVQRAPEPAGWQNLQYPDGEEALPVVGVTWNWANAYCLALGKRLPTEAEWEVSARGPAGLLHPWGNDDDAVDLTDSAKHAVGSVAANRSVFGAYDLEGNAWEWVGQPYAAIEPFQRVRRGGENGRVRGVTFREVVNPVNRSVIAETGFRCAATQVDPDAAPLEFDLGDHVVEDSPAAKPAVLGEVRTDFIDESFDDPDTGWPEIEEDTYRVGYHAPDWYHVEAGSPGLQVLGLGGFEHTDAIVEARAYIDSTGTEVGTFRYGVVVRAHGEDRAPLGALGPNRATNFYAFVIDTRAGLWQVLHEDSRPLLVLEEGPLDGNGYGWNPQDPDTFTVEMDGSDLQFFLNGEWVAAIDSRGTHLSGDLGFFVETFDESKAHVHYDSVRVSELGSR